MEGLRSDRELTDMDKLADRGMDSWNRAITQHSSNLYIVDIVAAAWTMLKGSATVEFPTPKRSIANVQNP